jgi:hypothetical protein
MQRQSRFPTSTGSFSVLILLCATLVAGVASAEQTYVTRYDVYAGYSYFNSPKINLTARGIHLQAGLRPTRWYSLGLDYTNVSGDLTLSPELLPTSLQDRLSLQLRQLAAVGRLPANYSLVVPTDSKTQTFTAGPQVAVRRWVPITPFIRPSIGLIRELAEPKPMDAIATAIVHDLAPEGTKKDWTMFYGVGGGFDINFNPHFALRVQADYVWDHLFPDVLTEGRPTLRFSVGPAFNFGRNIVGH